MADLLSFFQKQNAERDRASAGRDTGPGLAPRAKIARTLADGTAGRKQINEPSKFFALRRERKKLFDFFKKPVDKRGTCVYNTILHPTGSGELERMAAQKNFKKGLDKSDFAKYNK